MNGFRRRMERAGWVLKIIVLRANLPPWHSVPPGCLSLSTPELSHTDNVNSTNVIQSALDQYTCVNTAFSNIQTETRHQWWSL